VWLQNRLANIEAVENLSFYLPGLREHYDLFPKEIYYSATLASKKAMEKKWIQRDEDGKVGQSLPGYKNKSRAGKILGAILAADQSSLRQKEDVAEVPNGTSLTSSPEIGGGATHDGAGGMEERIKAIVNERLNVSENTVRDLKAQLNLITQILRRMEKGKQAVSSSFD